MLAEIRRTHRKFNSSCSSAKNTSGRARTRMRRATSSLEAAGAVDGSSGAAGADTTCRSMLATKRAWAPSWPAYGRTPTSPISTIFAEVG